MEISNKSLALILVAAIVISLGGTMVSLNRLSAITVTGMATNSTDQATTNFSITSNISIVFAVDQLDFGSGSVNGTLGGIQECILESNNTSPVGSCIDFVQTPGEFIVFNDGSATVNLTVVSNATADDFIGGTAANNSFQWKASENESSTCADGVSVTSFTNVSSGTDISDGVEICTNMDYQDSQDSVSLNLHLEIPEDAYNGEHRATITAYGVAAS